MDDSGGAGPVAFPFLLSLVQVGDMLQYLPEDLFDLLAGQFGDDVGKVLDSF